MLQIRRLYFFLLLLFWQKSELIAQTRYIDSLKMELVKANASNGKLAIILSLCESGNNMHPDSLLAYANLAEVFSQNNTLQQIRAAYYKSVAYTTKGMPDTALIIANTCIHLLQHQKTDHYLLANTLNQMGRCYMRKNEYGKAIEIGYKVIAQAEQANDMLLQVKGKTLIGWAYLEMGQTSEALRWHIKALQTTSDTILLDRYGILYANLALNYMNLGNNDSAFYFIDKAVDRSRRYENLFALSNSLAIRSQIYIRSGSAALAEPSLKEVIAIRKLIGDPFYIVSDMSQLALYYAHYGSPDKGIEICLEGIGIAREYKLSSKLLFLYSSLGENYKAKGDTTAYAGVLEKIIELKDSVFKDNSATALAEIQTKYELEKKENYILLQRQEIERQQYFLYGLLIVAFMAVLIGWILFRTNRKQQKLKLAQMQQEEKQRLSLEIMKAGQNERKRIAADLHDNLGAYAASIASNIDHIRINENKQAGEMVLADLKNNSAAIVSQLSDTIWVLKKDNLSLTAISDRIKVFIQRIRHHQPGMQMDVYENISTDILIPASRAFLIYRLIQDAIQLALKNTGITKLDIYFESNQHWRIVIAGSTESFETKMNATLKQKWREELLCKASRGELNIDWPDDNDRVVNIIISPTTN